MLVVAIYTNTYLALRGDPRTLRVVMGIIMLFFRLAFFLFAKIAIMHEPNNTRKEIIINISI